MNTRPVISYQLRTGAAVDESNAQEVLARCPIHGLVVRVDGSIEQGPKSSRCNCSGVMSQACGRVAERPGESSRGIYAPEGRDRLRGRRVATPERRATALDSSVATRRAPWVAADPGVETPGYSQRSLRDQHGCDQQPYRLDWP